jgi:hypothetical protein
MVGMTHYVPSVCINHPLAIETLNKTSSCMDHMCLCSKFELVIYVTRGLIFDVMASKLTLIGAEHVGFLDCHWNGGYMTIGSSVAFFSVRQLKSRWKYSLPFFIQLVTMHESCYSFVLWEGDYLLHLRCIVSLTSPVSTCRCVHRYGL